MKKMINKVRVEGRVYEHKLEVKQVKNKDSQNFGKNFIGGSIDIATDDECLNVVTVYFTYVTPTTKAGGANATYQTLEQIINSGKSVIVDGKDAATKVRIDTNVAINDFISRDGEMVSAKRCEGGFAHIANELNDKETERKRFETDMVITNVTHVEADEERHIEKDYVTIKGYAFNFRNDLLPVEYSVEDEGGMKYFESLEVSQASPVFTKVWGHINCSTVITKTTEESAFGEPIVRESRRTSRKWVVVGANPEVYEFGAAEVLTADDMKKGLADRELHLANVKKRNEEYQASKAASENAFTAAPAATVSAAEGGFNF